MTDIDPDEANHKRLECVIPHNPELAWNWTELWYPRCVITTKLSMSPRSVGGISQNIWATSQIGDFACLTCGLPVNRFPLLPMSWQQLPNLGLLWPWFCSYSMTKDLACSTTAMCFFGWIPQFFTVWHLHLHRPIENLLQDTFQCELCGPLPLHLHVTLVQLQGCKNRRTAQVSSHTGMVCSDSYPFLMPVNTNDPSIPFDISNNINH
jgi:hypothetical protein